MPANGDLRALMEEGAVAVVSFGDYGELLEVQGSLDPASARLLAFLTTATNVHLALQAEAVERSAGLPLLPFTGWVYRGATYSVVVSGHRAVVVPTERANYDRLIQLLEGGGG